MQENADGLYDPTIGALGDTLEQAKVPRAVIANGDGAQPVVDDPLQPYQRAAVNALMGSDGRVPAGSVSDDLLEPDPHAPFGLRTDNDAAYRAFSDAWQQGGVVLVEGSDLLRADLYSDFLTDDQARVEKQAALHRVDELVGRMLADVDPAHDAVFVVSPASPRRGSGLAVTGIRAPGVAPEFLRSATSRRNGFVYVIDIAPTILDLLGIDVPKEMEGRAMEVVHGTGAGPARHHARARQRGRGVPRLEGRSGQQRGHHARRRPRPRRRTRGEDQASGVRARCGSSRSRCWDSCSPRTRRSPCTSGAATTRPRTSGSWWWRRSLFAGACRLLGGRRSVPPARDRARGHRRGARARPRRGRAPRAQHGVRLLGHRRDPRRRARATSRSRN